MLWIDEQILRSHPTCYLLMTDIWQSIFAKKIRYGGIWTGSYTLTMPGGKTNMTNNDLLRTKNCLCFEPDIGNFINSDLEG